MIPNGKIWPILRESFQKFVETSIVYVTHSEVNYVNSYQIAEFIFFYFSCLSYHSFIIIMFQDNDERNPGINDSEQILMESINGRERRENIEDN